MNFMVKLNKDKIWNDCLESIKVSVSEANFKTWIAQTHLKSLREKNKRYVAEIGCNSSFVKATVESRYFGLIQDNLKKILEGDIDIIFVVEESTRKIDHKKDSAPLFEDQKVDEDEIAERLAKAKVRPGFTFENYAVSSTNQMAYAASEAVVQSPGEAYNPLFIWGGVGVGKTHLMYATANALIQNGSLETLFCTAEDFTNDIIEGIKSKSTQKFRDKYRKLDTLVLDDIQFIAGKNTIQEEFFHTFNTLAGAKKQIILASDKPPTEINKLESRLISRFEAGLIVDISAPDFELRCAIIQIKAKERGIDIDTELVQLIAANITTARKIEGYLVKLSSEAKFRRAEIDEDLIKKLLSKADQQNGSKVKANPSEIITVVCKYYSVGKRDLLGSSRRRPIARPRQVLMYILRTDLGLPYQEVGRLAGGRDHSTAMHAVGKITILSKSDVNIREDIVGIKQML